MADIHEVGPIVAECIERLWENPENRIAEEACFSAGVTLIPDKLTEDDHSLEGKTFVFTGSMENLNRREAKEIVENLGGRVSGAVSKKTNYVVVGPGAGSKGRKAEELEIKVLSEEDFFKLVKG